MRRTFWVVIFSISLATPLLVSAQSPDPLLGPIVQCNGAAGVGLTECQLCDAVTLAQTLLNFLVAIAAFIAVIIFCYAGFTMLTAAGNVSKITEAWSMFTNVGMGLVIVLAGWLIVDTVMKYAFEPNSATDPGSPLYQESLKSGFGPWNQINCVAQVEQRGSTAAAAQPTSAGLAPAGTGIVSGNGQQCSPGSGCSADALKLAGYTDDQAKAMSCIAVLESSGISTRVNDKPQYYPPDKIPKGAYQGYVSNACGYYQILPSHWEKAKNHRKDQLGDCNASTPCADIGCNIQTARILSEGRIANGEAPYGDWTCPGCNNRVQNECVNRYDPQPYPRKSV